MARQLHPGAQPDGRDRLGQRRIGCFIPRHQRSQGAESRHIHPPAQQAELQVGERLQHRLPPPAGAGVAFGHRRTFLQGEQAGRYLKAMYGNQPGWSPKLGGTDRFRAIVNIFTRMRYCTPNGRIGFEEKGRPGTQQPGFYPWFSVPGHAPRELPIVCGHWSTLGLFMGLGVYAIDTGAIWGGTLTALELGPEPRVHAVPGRSGAGARVKD